MKKTGIVLLMVAALFCALLVMSASAVQVMTCKQCGSTKFSDTYRYAPYINRDGTESSYHKRVYTCLNCKADYDTFMAGDPPHSGGTATCQARAVCTLCGSAYGEYGHVLEHHAAQAATCTKEGWQAYDSCTKCDYSTKVTISKLAHDLEHRGGRPATCMAEGWKEYDACKNCAYTTYEPIPKLGHLFEHHPGQAATCTEDGWTEYDACGRCDYTTREPIPAPGHALKQHAAQPATCTDDGWNAYETCENCAYTTFKLIPATGHSYAKQTVEPTCTKDGYTLYTCADCSDTYTTDIVKKLYHWFGEWSPNEDDTHSAHCRRKGCKYVAKLDCQKFEFPLDGESLILCPVCGEEEKGERLERIAKASAKIVTGRHPKGELIVRTDGTFLSVAYEYAGQVSEAAAQVKITLPADVLNGRKPVLVSLDGAETALSFEAAGDTLTFTLDCAEAEVPVFLIRLTDEA